MKSFFEIMKTVPINLNSIELKIKAFGLFIYFIITISILSCLVMFFVNIGEAILFFIAILPLGILYSLCCLLFNYLNKWFDLFLINSDKTSFEGVMVQNLFVGVGVWLFFMNLGLFHGHFFNGCGLGFGFLFASWVTFLRKDSVFNEDSLFGVESDGEVIGYNPLYYCLLSFVCGIVLFYIAFMGLGHFVDFGFSYFVPCVIKLIVAFVVMILIISPDLTSRYVPWDIRTKSGFNKYGVLCAFVCVVVGVLLVHFLGG